MSERRVRKRRGWLVVIIAIIVAMMFLGITLVNKSNEGMDDTERGYVSNMSDKSDLELERMALEDLLKDLKGRGFEYQETDDVEGEQYGFNLVFNIINGKEDYCLLDEYRNHGLTMAYCELVHPTVYEDDIGVEE